MSTGTQQGLAATGVSLVAGEERRGDGEGFRGFMPATGETGTVEFTDATPADVADAASAAATAAPAFAAAPGERRAHLLRDIADRLGAASEQLVAAADAETALGEGRLSGEVVRTRVQLEAFADMVEEGSYLDAIIDPASSAGPLPRPDLRRVQVALGPVAVFGASNFPFAFSVAGGDTASALAAGCPVVVKAHPAHPATSELTGRIIAAALAEGGWDPGVFSLLQGRDPEVSKALVGAPQIKAVGFTGSLRVGRALFDQAAARPEPIPVYAEMGSLNPLFVTPGALAARGEEIAAGYTDSMMLGGGQFCTKPGLLFVPEGEAGEALVASVAERLGGRPSPALLTSSISEGLDRQIRHLEETTPIRPVGRGEEPTGDGFRLAARLYRVGWKALRERPELVDEFFGPVAIAVTCPPESYAEVAAYLPGNLTATVHAEDGEHADVAGLVDVLKEKAGRVIWNGYPTGVAVTAAMHHGGPYPATTTPAHTSVGLTAVRRFLRPVSYQNMPEALLPPALHDANPLGIWRLVDGHFTRDPLAPAEAGK